jgi:hypothetical protein
MYFNPLRAFLPVVMTLFGLGFIKMIVDIFRFNWHLAPSTVILLLGSVQLAAIGFLADLIVRRSKL